MMQTIGRTSQERNEKLPYLDLARALVADAMRHNDTRWLSSYMGEFCLGMLSYTPSVLARIEAVTADKNQAKKIKHVYMWKGKLLSISEIAKLEGVKRSILQNRVYIGWSLEKAVSTPLKEETQKKFWWKDRFYTLSEIAKATGRDYNLLYNRVCCNGWTIEKAVDTPTGASGKRIRP